MKRPVLGSLALSIAAALIFGGYTGPDFYHRSPIVALPGLVVGFVTGQLYYWALHKLNRPAMRPGLWFHQADLKLHGAKTRVFMAVFGFFVGFAATGLFLLFLGVFSEWLAFGTAIGALVTATIGLVRNKIVILVARRGFPPAFYFHRIAYWSEWVGIALGGVAVVYGRGWPGPLIDVLPFAGGYLISFYFYIAFFPIYDREQEGRLSICQFLTESVISGRGYSWLKRGLQIVEQRLQDCGVSVPRNALFFGSSYSLLEGSCVESDRYGLYLLGEWSSQSDTLYPIYDIASWFLHRSRQGDLAGFSVSRSLWERIFGTSAERTSNVLNVAIIIVTIATVILGILQLFSHR